MHLLISEPPQTTPSTVLKVLKQRVSRDLRKKRFRRVTAQLRLPFSQDGEELPRFWQACFYDFNVYSRQKRKEKLEYMHANPVKRGLAKHPGQWPWSSFRAYEMGEAGLVKIDPV